MGVWVCCLTACVAPVCCEPENEGGDSAASIDDFVGLWNSSISTETGEDIIYTRIMRNGDIVEYDFDGDSVDKGLDCYSVETGSLHPLTQHTFVIRADMHEHIEFAISLKLTDNGQALELRRLEPMHEKSVDTFERPPETWHRVRDDLFLSNEPSCQK